MSVLLTILFLFHHYIWLILISFFRVGVDRPYCIYYPWCATTLRQPYSIRILFAPEFIFGQTWWTEHCSCFIPLSSIGNILLLRCCWLKRERKVSRVYEGGREGGIVCAVYGLPVAQPPTMFGKDVYPYLEKYQNGRCQLISKQLYKKGVLGALHVIHATAVKHPMLRVKKCPGPW